MSTVTIRFEHTLTMKTTKFHRMMEAGVLAQACSRVSESDQHKQETLQPNVISDLGVAAIVIRTDSPMPDSEARIGKIMIQ
jgi:hypothetical protein